MNITTWLHSNFKVKSQHEDEYNFHCPKCQHKDFRFNARKRVGYCFRASCHWAPTLEDLNKISRRKIDFALEATNVLPVAPESGIKEIVLPTGAEPIIQRAEGSFQSRFPRAVEEITKRGVPVSKQYRFNLHYDGQRVYVPVYAEGKLINYVGRAAWWKNLTIPRYAYCPGAGTRDTLFNWDEMKLRTYVVLVENTFNAIWLMDTFNCTTNFGSDLSQKQINLIKVSKVKNVILLWDEQTNKTAAKVVNKLKSEGIKSAYISIKGQPDNHTPEVLLDGVQRALTASQKGAMMVAL